MPIQSPAPNIMKCDVGLTFISGLQTFQSTISQNISQTALVIKKFTFSFVTDKLFRLFCDF